MIVLLTGHRKSAQLYYIDFLITPKVLMFIQMIFVISTCSFQGMQKNIKNKSAAIKRLININKIKLKDFCKQYNYPLLDLKE